MSIFSDPDGWNDWAESNPERKKRNVTYKKGETIRRYKHRTLHIHHPQTEEQWQKATHARRSKAAKLAAKNRAPSYSKGIYADPWGLTPSQRRMTERYQAERRNRESANMGVEDMRALLKDDHWEEVCGHTRWKYDRNSTLKEFRRYQMAHRGMY